MSKILEINPNPEDCLVSLPIVAFPPFKLRAALVEKDPVIWLHLLESYNQFLAHLIQHREISRLDEKTWEQLCIFVRSFLHEISSEMGQLLSLGHNVDVTRNLEYMNRWMLKLVEVAGGVHKLQMNAATLWDFVRVYVETDPNTVRKIISEGGKIDCTYMIHNHLEYLIGSGKFDRFDLKSFENLIDRKSTTKSSTTNKEDSKIKKISKDKKYDANKFIDKFVTTKWIEILENLYSDGKGVLAKSTKNLMIVSLLNCSVQNISSLATQLGISSLPSLKLYPLFGTVLWIGYTEKDYFKGLETRLPFLRVVKTGISDGTSTSTDQAININIDDIKKVQSLFPDIPVPKINKLFQKFGNVEVLIDALFENPSIVEDMEEEETEFLKETIGLKDFKNKLKIANSKMKSKKSQNISDLAVPDDVRNKTMEAALKLLYDANEDERDDTYDEAESQASTTEKTKEQAHFDKIEEYLWGLLKKDAQAFARTSRKSSLRKDMRNQTKWTDEQIEGWARMIERSPARAQMLEEKFMFMNPNRVKSGRKQTNGEEDSDEEEPRLNAKPEKNTSSPDSNSNNSNTKRQNARNEKNKSSRANHNRKAQHDKKMNKGF